MDGPKRRSADDLFCPNIDLLPTYALKVGYRRTIVHDRHAGPDNGAFLEPLDLERADIAELCAACVIDHSILPVAHTVGGSGAGYARWQRFLQSGLATYTRDRNDAAIEWPRGVSRLSAYIHHGQVSPFRIARDAVQRGGEGADKFLDELLFWTLSATDKVSPSRLQAVSCG